MKTADETLKRMGFLAVKAEPPYSCEYRKYQSDGRYLRIRIGLFDFIWYDFCNKEGQPIPIHRPMHPIVARAVVEKLDEMNEGEPNGQS